MNRRGFLGFLAKAGAVALAAPVLLRSVPAATPHLSDVTFRKTNFGAIDPECIKVWSRKLWAEAQRESFIPRMVGANAPIQLLH